MSDSTENAHQVPGPPHRPAAPNNSQNPTRLTAAVVSADPVWARLLALNLSARGIIASDHPVDGIESALQSVPKGGWLIVDVDGCPNDEVIGWQALVSEMTELDVNAAVVVDRREQALSQSEMRYDVLVERSPDMRVMVRDLISTFNSTPLERALGARRPAWH